MKAFAMDDLAILIIVSVIGICYLFFYKEEEEVAKKEPDSRNKYFIDGIPIPEKAIKFQFFNKEKYKEYLKTQQWKHKKFKRIKLDGYMCQQCFERVKLNTSNCHHITYNRLGREHMEDIITVCIACHKKIHEHHGKNATNYPLIPYQF